MYRTELSKNHEFTYNFSHQVGVFLDIGYLFDSYFLTRLKAPGSVDCSESPFSDDFIEFVLLLDGIPFIFSLVIVCVLSWLHCASVAIDLNTKLLLIFINMTQIYNVDYLF